MSATEVVETHHAPRTGARALRVGLLGYGQVGQAVAELARRDARRLLDAGLEIEFTRALIRDARKPRHGPELRLTQTPAEALAGVDAVIEVLGGVEPARTLVAAALRAGVPVVTANKTLVAACGQELQALARRHRTGFAFEAAVVAGVPFVGALARRPLAAAASRIDGIVNGTSNVVLTAMAGGTPFEVALQGAVAAGYAEPDSTADISGRDAAEKLAILLQLCGHPHATAEQLPRAGIDMLSPDDIRGAAALGGVIKPVALASLDGGGAWTGPAFVPAAHYLASVSGVDNAVRIHGAGRRPMTFRGPGAGPEVTAATILDDLSEVALGGSPVRVDSVTASLERRDFSRPPAGSWFLALRAPGPSTVELSEVIEFLVPRGVLPAHVHCEEHRCYLLTLPVSWTTVHEAVQWLDALGVRPLVLPAFEGGES